MFFNLKNCLGALDGTYIIVHVPNQDKPKYKARKGIIAMNVLTASHMCCRAGKNLHMMVVSFKMQFLGPMT